MSAPSPARGLTATELGLVVAELQQVLPGARVLDAVQLVDGDDLLLVLQAPAGKLFLHLALGGGRARITATQRRFDKSSFATGPGADALRAAVAQGEVLRIDQPPGERRFELRLRTASGELRLVGELFSARGLWALVDAEGRVRQLSRPVTTAVRTLRVGDRYAPPPAGTVRDEPPPRFQPPVLAAVDALFSANDAAAGTASEHARLLAICDRALQKLAGRQQGLQTQLAEAGRIGELRAEADLMLAYAHLVQRGQTRLTVPDPLREGAERHLELEPGKPVPLQAKARYDRARRLQDGVAIAQQRLAAAAAEQAALLPLRDQLAAAAAASFDADALAAVSAGLAALGLLPRPKAVVAAPKKKRHPFREYTSAEGYPILVGRTNEQNDELTLRVANGNDLWLHVGGGRAGSHVVVRLPKLKTASLETLLDAGTLAVHFSKARGERTVDVVYTQRKHVKKPKGLPAGAVVPSQTKTISVRLDAERLRRLLDGAATAD